MPYCQTCGGHVSRRYRRVMCADSVVCVDCAPGRGRDSFGTNIGRTYRIAPP